MTEAENTWNNVISSLQDVCAFSETYCGRSEEAGVAEVEAHSESLSEGKRLVTAVLENVEKLMAEKKTGKTGRSFHVSVYNPSEPIVVGLEVAYRLRRSHNFGSEWIQCVVLKVLGDGTKFEIRDPEPDENNNPGQVFKAGWKDVLLLPPGGDLLSYPYGTKVLARYPETTTFYLAEVIGTKRDGKCRLRFDGEEEEGKETEVERRLVLPAAE